MSVTLGFKAKPVLLHCTLNNWFLVKCLLKTRWAQSPIHGPILQLAVGSSDTGFASSFISLPRESIWFAAWPRRISRDACYTSKLTAELPGMQMPGLTLVLARHNPQALRSACGFCFFIYLPQVIIIHSQGGKPQPWAMPYNYLRSHSLSAVPQNFKGEEGFWGPAGAALSKLTVAEAGLGAGDTGAVFPQPVGLGTGLSPSMD